jgi:hypothetical protein
MTSWVNLLKKLSGAKYHEIAVRVNAEFYRRFNRNETVDIMAENWDNLIILDACRYDMLVEHAPPDWDVQSRRSPGSDSSEFIEKSFHGRELHDTVYVTANPHALDIPDGTFHTVVYLLEDYWDAENQTVMPETMVEQTLTAHQQYSNKRLISHWMQPHFPFIGELGQTLGTSGIGQKSNTSENDAPHPWVALMESRDIETESVIEAYNENLQEAMGSLQILLDKLPGKTIVTSDHGNLIGEWTWPLPLRTFGHPAKLHKSELVTVPWVEFDSETRRDVQPDPPQATADVNDEIVLDRLESLGYV